MKKVFRLGITLLAFILIACQFSKHKPDSILEQEAFENMLFDVYLLQSSEIYYPEILTKNGINSMTYIYEKYRLDSLSYAENINFYSSNFKNYHQIHLQIKQRVEDKLKNIDKVNKSKAEQAK